MRSKPLPSSPFSHPSVPTYIYHPVEGINDRSPSAHPSASRNLPSQTHHLFCLGGELKVRPLPLSSITSIPCTFVSIFFFSLFSFILFFHFFFTVRSRRGRFCGCARSPRGINVVSRDQFPGTIDNIENAEGTRLTKSLDAPDIQGSPSPLSIFSGFRYTRHAKPINIVYIFIYVHYMCVYRDTMCVCVDI